MSIFPNHWHANPHFWMDEGLLSISPVCCGQLLNILITLESYGIFRSNLACVFILILSSHCDEGLPSIILAGRGILVKMFITLEPHGNKRVRVHLQTVETHMKYRIIIRVYTVCENEKGLQIKEYNICLIIIN